MNRIRFSCEWDKLKEPQFTTFRSYNFKKEMYYHSQVGKEMTLWISTGGSFRNGHKIGTATLLRVSEVQPGKLPAEELRRDVLRGGQVDSAWFKRLCAMNRALLLEFENHTGLLKEGRW